MILKKHLRHIFNSRAIILYVSFFLIISCGIPTNIYLKEGITNEAGVSYYQFSLQAEDTDSYITTLTFNLVDDSLVVENTPSICYFYSIYPSNLTNFSESNFSSQIISSFNSTYSQLPGRRLDTSQTDSSVISVDYNDFNIKLYKFTYNDLDQEPLSYLATIKSLTYNSEYQANFKIKQIKTSNQSTFNFEEYNSSFFKTNPYLNSSNLELKRFNTKEFKASSIDEEDYDYIYSETVNNDTSYKVIVFAALTVEGQFSNIFWTNLHKVGSFDL